MEAGLFCPAASVIGPSWAPQVPPLDVPPSAPSCLVLPPQPNKHTQPLAEPSEARKLTAFEIRFIRAPLEVVAGLPRKHKLCAE